MSGVFNRGVALVRDLALGATGGPARLQIVLVLAAVLGLDTADKATVSALADQLKTVFHLNNTDIGLLLAVVSFVGAVGTLPAGILADRIRRKTILLVVIPIWALAMIASGTATSYVYLLLTRLAMGAVAAAAWPCIATLTGDFFPAADRARLFGLILGGELVGAGIGFFIAGEVSSFADWRWGFYVMAVPSLAVAWLVWRYLPEPARGTQAWIEVGETDAYRATQESAGGRSDQTSSDRAGGGAGGSVQDMVRRADVEPRRELVLDEGAGGRSWWWVMRYLFKVPTYGLLILASSLVYYFFSGFRAFAMLFFGGHYGLAHSVVTGFVIAIGFGGLAGLIAGGHLSERFRRRGRLNARIVVPGVALFAAAMLLGFGIWTGQVGLGVVLLIVGAFSLGVAAPPIDAARLDIVPASLWGRAEAGRMSLRYLFEGGAPLLFGAVSGWLGGGAEALMWTFLMMLVTLLAASSLAVVARRTYLPDVATAAASMARLQHGDHRKNRENERDRGDQPGHAPDQAADDVHSRKRPPRIAGGRG